MKAIYAESYTELVKKVNEFGIEQKKIVCVQKLPEQVVLLYYGRR